MNRRPFSRGPRRALLDVPLSASASDVVEARIASRSFERRPVTVRSIVDLSGGSSGSEDWGLVTDAASTSEDWGTVV